MLRIAVFLFVIGFIGCCGNSGKNPATANEPITTTNKTISTQDSIPNQNVTCESWNFFSGYLGKKYMYLQVYLYNNDEAKGFYVDDSCKTKIFLKGYIKNFTNLQLTAYRDNNVIGIYTATRDSLYQGTTTFNGEWTDSSHSVHIPFSFKDVASTCGSYERRFSRATDKSDSEVENFAMKIKIAILNGDKKWLADQVEYPFSLGIEKLSTPGYRYIQISSRTDFINKYGRYFTPAYKTYIRSACPLNLTLNLPHDINIDMNGIIIGDCSRMPTKLCINGIFIPHKFITSIN